MKRSYAIWISAISLIFMLLLIFFYILPVAAPEWTVMNHPQLSAVISSYYNISESDLKRTTYIAEVMRKRFGDEPLKELLNEYWNATDEKRESVIAYLAFTSEYNNHKDEVQGILINELMSCSLENDLGRNSYYLACLYFTGSNLGQCFLDKVLVLNDESEGFYMKYLHAVGWYSDLDKKHRSMVLDLVNSTNDNIAYKATGVMDKLRNNISEFDDKLMKMGIE